MENFEYFSRILYSRKRKIRFSFATCLHPWKNHCAGKRKKMFVSLHNKFEFKCTRDYVEKWQVLSEQVHSQYLFGCRSIFMEGVALEHFNKLKPSSIHMAQFHSRFLMKVISMLALLQHIFLLLFNLFSQKG